MRIILNTLYVTTQNVYLHLENDTLRVDVEREKKLQVRHVAKVCESTGQRVQNSVFECKVNQMQLEELERRLLDEIDEKYEARTDSNGADAAGSRYC